MDKRKNHRDLTKAEKSNLIAAILKLKNGTDSLLHPGQQSRYDDFVEVHRNAMTGPDMFDPMPHGTPLFYPWHRILLRQFELELQRVKSDPSITLPYWDWDLNGLSNPFTPDFMGGDGDHAQQGHVSVGPFTSAAFTIRVWDASTGDPVLRREFGDDPTAWLPTAADVMTGLGKTPYWPGAGCWERVSESVLHNPVHRWVGGNMAEAASPNDPIFFLHHAYLDCLWERWKTQHSTSAPYVPQSGSPKYDLDATLVFNAAGKPSPWTSTWRVRDTMVPGDLGYSYD